MKRRRTLLHYVKYSLMATMILLWGSTDLALGAQVEIVRNEAILDFPHSVTFRLESERDIVGAVLNYDVSRQSCVKVNTQVPVPVADGVAEWTWVMSRSGNPPPGAELWWSWTLTDAAGNRYTTPRQTLTFVDERFDWRAVSAEGVRLHWYAGDEVGPILLDAAVSGLEELEAEMGIRLQNDVNLYIYGNAADMREAVLYVQGWAGGVAFAPYNSILIGVRPTEAEGWGRDVVRHELAHLVIEQFGRSCLGGDRPSWLEEGLAMVAEGPADEDMIADIEAAIEENEFEPLRSLSGSFPAHTEEATLAYSQSYSVVTFLLDAYGQEKMRALLKTLAEGVTYDAALADVYGFNMDGLETRWREWLGAPPRAIPPTPTPVRAGAVPTVPPLAAARTVPTPEGLGQSAPAPAEPAAGLCNAPWVSLLLLGAVLLRGRDRRLVGMGHSRRQS